jgi:cytoskeleton protein RodZ
MSEPQHPQPHDHNTSARPSAQASAQSVVPLVPHSVDAAALDSLAAVGVRLTQLRESKGWSIDDVSFRLKVAPQKIRALEAGDISQLPGTTFAVGVVRSYAKMLGADPAPFTQALRRVKGVPEPDLSMPASAGTGLPRGKVSVSLSGGSRHRSWLWGVAAVVVAVIALAMWHTGGGDSSAWLARLRASTSGVAHGASVTSVEGPTVASAAVTTESSASASTTATVAPAALALHDASSALPIPAPVPAPVAPSAASSQAVVSAVAAPRASEPQVSAPAVKAAVVASAAVPTKDTASAVGEAFSGESIVAIRVTQDSWFSLRDRNGKDVFSGLVRAGDAKEVSGEPPFKVTVGNKAGLDSMTLDGQPVDSAKYSAAKGNVARFSLP